MWNLVYSRKSPAKKQAEPKLRPFKAKMGFPREDWLYSVSFRLGELMATSQDTSRITAPMQ